MNFAPPKFSVALTTTTNLTKLKLFSVNKKEKAFSKFSNQCRILQFTCSLFFNFIYKFFLSRATAIQCVNAIRALPL